MICIMLEKNAYHAYYDHYPGQDHTGTKDIKIRNTSEKEITINISKYQPPEYMGLNILRKAIIIKIIYKLITIFTIRIPFIKHKSCPPLKIKQVQYVYRTSISKPKIKVDNIMLTHNDLYY